MNVQRLRIEIERNCRHWLARTWGVPAYSYVLLTFEIDKSAYLRFQSRSLGRGIIEVHCTFDAETGAITDASADMLTEEGNGG